MGRDGYSRREFGKATGAAISVGLVGLPGCVASVPGVDRHADTSWFPAPDEFSAEHYNTFSVNAGGLRDHEDVIGTQRVSDIISSYLPSESVVDVDGDEVSRVAGGGSIDLQFRVLRGGFDRNGVEEDLEGNDFDESSHGSYSFYERSDGRSFGVGDGVVIAAASRDDVETIIDAKGGDANRYVDENDDYSKVATTVGQQTHKYLYTNEERRSTDTQTGRFENSVGGGSGVRIGGETGKAIWVRVFSDAADVVTDDLESWTEADGTFDDVDDITVTQNGRAGVVRGTVDTKQYYNN